MDNRVIVNDSHAFELQWRGLMRQVNTSMPGVIVVFYPDDSPPTCDVQPSVKMQYTNGTDVQFLDLPVIVKVPIALQFSKSSGVLVTMPIMPGDDCLLIFSQRAIDNVVEHGGIQPPIQTDNQYTCEQRMFDLTDAICIPGLVCGNVQIENYNQNAIELRTLDRSTYLNVENNGKVNVKAPNGMFLEGNLTVTGTITGTVVKTLANINLGTHTHNGVQSGSGSTGLPQ